jgi:hypothetical protein
MPAPQFSAAWRSPRAPACGPAPSFAPKASWCASAAAANQHPTIVGDYCSITHRVVLHGCRIGDNCLIGIGATIMEGVVIGENSIVAGHSFVADGTLIPANSIVMGTPAKVVRTANNFIANRINAMLYHRNALCYAKGEHRGWEGPAYQAEAQAWQDEAERQFAERYGTLPRPGP